MRDIALFTDQTIFGGGETNLLRLAASLAAVHRVTVVAPAGRLLGEAARAGLPTIALPRHRSRWIRGVPFAGGALRTLAARFELVHAYSLHVLPGLLGHPALVWTVHGPWEKPWGRRARVLGASLRRVVAVSRDVARHCAFPDAMLSVLPLGAVAERDCRDGLPATRRLDARDALRVGVLGRLQPVKGQDLAIDAIAAVAAAMPDRRIDLAIAGEADPSNAVDRRFAAALRERAARVVAAQPNLSIGFEGFVARPRDFLDGLDLLCVPSRYESFSMVTVEALARGVPVVVPDCGGPAEIVDAPAIGLKFRPGDATALAAALAVALGGHAHSPAAMSARARLFSVERQRDRHLALYDEVLAR